jgi:O-Antigen ligase
MTTVTERTQAADVRSAGVWFIAATTLAAGAIAVTMGALVASDQLLPAVVLLALPLAAWLSVSYPGVAVGGLWLVAMNGIPLINFEGGGGQLRPTDVAVIAIALIGLLQWIISSRSRHPFPTSLLFICLFFGAWWLFTLARSINAGVPATDAFFFGRDFLSLVIVIPPAWVILRNPAAWRQCAAIILAGGGAYGLAYVCGSLGLVNSASFTHPQLVRSIAGVQRIYTPMNDLVMTVAIFGAAFLATTARTRVTPYVAAITAITLLAFLLQLTRAAYIGMAVGIVIAIVIAMSRGAAVRKILMRRVTLSTVVLTIVVFAAIGFGSSGGPTTVIDERVSSGLTQVGEKSGTVGYRITLYGEMLEVLGKSWPAGLGFLHPRDKYFPSLPSGSIRNTDVGLLNAVMTMGVIGLLLLFSVLFGFARYVARTATRRPTWLVVGFFGWLALIIACSPTLVTLFSPTGLLLTGLTLVLCGAYTGSLTTITRNSDYKPRA